MPESRFKSCHEDLLDLLGLGVPPIGIAFLSEIPSGIRRIERALPPPTPDGRTGAVAASCVFWIEATEAVFATVAEDHGNCSVGSLTHGFKTMAQIAGNADVAALCESGWVTPDAVAKIAVGARQADEHRLRAFARPRDRARGNPAAAQRQAADAAARRLAGTALRRQASMPHHPDRQRARRDLRQRRLHAEPGAHRDAEQRGDLRDSCEPGG